MNIDWSKCPFQPLIKRPEWTGEGLPPVGTVCEAQIYSGKGDLIWVEARVLHHHPRHKKSAAIAHGGEELLAWTSMFRPIRTPEQIAAEERDKAIDEMVPASPLLDKGWSRRVCEALYDAGYRKQVAQ